MTHKQFKNSFLLLPLSKALNEANSIRKVRAKLKKFSCPINADLESFLHAKAITFEQNLRSRAYLYIDISTKEVAAYFSIAIHFLDTDGISKDDTKIIPCYLIGQLGKSDAYTSMKFGKYILSDAVAIIDRLNDAIGGRFIILDSVNQEKVISFYQENLFSTIELESHNESIKMIKPYY